MIKLKLTAVTLSLFTAISSIDAMEKQDDITTYITSLVMKSSPEPTLRIYGTTIIIPYERSSFEDFKDGPVLEEGGPFISLDNKKLSFGNFNYLECMSNYIDTKCFITKNKRVKNYAGIFNYTNDDIINIDNYYIGGKEKVILNSAQGININTSIFASDNIIEITSPVIRIIDSFFESDKQMTIRFIPTPILKSQIEYISIHNKSKYINIACEIDFRNNQIKDLSPTKSDIHIKFKPKR
jgi:hypothetical protein